MGRAMALGLLEAGWDVFAVDRSDDGLATLRASATPAPEGGRGRLECLRIDLTREHAAQEVTLRALHRFGRIDALVNNAGINLMSHLASRTTLRPRFWEVEPALFNLFMDVNAGAMFRLGAAVAPHMVAAGSGRIVNVTTSLVSMLGAGMTPYAQSKAAAESLSAVMAADLEGTGVSVNVLVPGGPVDTPMVGDDPPIPRERYLPPDVMVPPLLWLLSGERPPNGMRFVARLWDATLAPAQSAAIAGAPVAWRGIAGEKWVPSAQD